MRRKVFISALAVMAVCGGLLWSQEDVSIAVLRNIGLEEEEIQEIQDLLFETEESLQRAHLELEGVELELRKALLDIEVDLEEVRKILEEAGKWKVEIEFIKTRRFVRLRQILGEERWRKYQFALRHGDELSGMLERLRGQVKNMRQEELQRLRQHLERILNEAR